MGQVGALFAVLTPLRIINRRHHRNQTQTHTERAEHKAQGGKKDHRPRRGANVVKEAHMLRLGAVQATGLIGL